MAGNVTRDPVGDHLLTPQNAALVVIDYQPSQFAGVQSMDRDLLLENIISTVKTAKAFGLPIVHSTINVATGRGQPTVPELAELLEDNPRSTGRPPTRGRMPTSSPPCAPQVGGS
jgi:nicotinamidase-related amidase